MFVKLGLQLISDMSMRIYSEASIAESPLLAAVFLVNQLLSYAWLVQFRKSLLLVNLHMNGFKVIQ
jgi:hypothetical protein